MRDSSQSWQSTRISESLSKRFLSIHVLDSSTQIQTVISARYLWRQRLIVRLTERLYFFLNPLMVSKFFFIQIDRGLSFWWFVHDLFSPVGNKWDIRDIPIYMRFTRPQWIAGVFCDLAITIIYIHIVLLFIWEFFWWFLEFSLLFSLLWFSSFPIWDFLKDFWPSFVVLFQIGKWTGRGKWFRKVCNLWIDILSCDPSTVVFEELFFLFFVIHQNGTSSSTKSFL